MSSHSSTSIVKFADDTVVLGLISNNDETTYLDEVERLTSWCQDNCLSLNVSKTKELIVDFRKRQQRPYTPLMISGTPVERVSSWWFYRGEVFYNFSTGGMPSPRIPPQFEPWLFCCLIFCMVLILLFNLLIVKLIFVHSYFVYLSLETSLIHLCK